MASATIRVYLDNCCFNRPFDDQGQVRVRLETEAKLEIQRRIKDGELELAWSYMLDFENQANPFEERAEAIARWRRAAVTDIEETPEVLRRANEIAGLGLRPKDALHIACALAAGCVFFLTTDDLIVKKLRGAPGLTVMGPAQFVIEVQ
ncbi:MAG: PIN domain-containing protein [Thermoguttaceae bacterium]|jgi:predicted nucleic acid-binding protein